MGSLESCSWPCSCSILQGRSEIQWTDFKQKIEDGQVKRLVFDGQRASVSSKTKRVRVGRRWKGRGLLKTVYQGADYWLNVPAGDAYLEDLKTMSESYDFTYVYEPVNEWGSKCSPMSFSSP